MNQLIVGDALQAMSGLPDGSTDLVLVDPPYGTTQCKWDTVIPFEPMWEQLCRVTKRGGAIIMTAQQPFTSALVMSNPRMFRQALVWRKNKPSGHLNAKKRHLTGHEDIVIFSDRPTTYNPQMWEARPANRATRKSFTAVYGAQRSTEYVGGQTARYPVSVLDFPVVNNDGTGEGRFHPTQKPVALMEYLVKTFSNEGDAVLDFAMGSGSTGVACVRAGRDFVGIELNPEYAEVARQRIAQEACKANVPTVLSWGLAA
jgi:16S rRNA G966 N2-methylase RsmD